MLRSESNKRKALGKKAISLALALFMVVGISLNVFAYEDICDAPYLCASYPNGYQSDQSPDSADSYTDECVDGDDCNKDDDYNNDSCGEYSKQESSECDGEKPDYEYEHEYDEDKAEYSDIDEYDEDNYFEPISFGLQEIVPFGAGMVVPALTPFEPVSDWAGLQAAVTGAGASVDIRVMNDITALTAINIPPGTRVYLRSNPASPNTYSISQSNLNERHFIVDGGVLMIGNIQLAGPGLGFGTEVGGVTMLSGQLQLFAGSEIIGNSWNYGGGVAVLGGILTMRGGDITGNRANNGGGVSVDNSSFTMYGGSISDNESSFNGGGVGLRQFSTFIMKGGTISGNENFSTQPVAVWLGGGGVLVYNHSYFYMYGGVIDNNTNASWGGGVSVVAVSTFTMEGGIISGNESWGGFGGGVHVGFATFILAGGTISGNTAVGHEGGGVVLRTFGTLIMHRGVIDNNTAERGGGIHISSLVNFGGDFIMNGGSISNNTATLGGGGGIFSEGDVTINGGIINGNTSLGGPGGGIAATDFSMLATSHLAIFTGNTAGTAHDWYQHPDFLTNNVPPIASGIIGGGGNVASIQSYSTSIAGAHLLNNYDINFVGFPIDYQTVTFNPNGGAFANTARAQLQGGTLSQTRLISQDAVGGVTVPFPTYEPVFSANGVLQNLSLPLPTRSGFTFGGWFNSAAEADDLTSQAGRVPHTYDVTADPSRSLYARWTVAPTSGGGWSQARPSGVADAPPEEHFRARFMVGFPDGNFMPSGNMTRAEAAAILVRTMTTSFGADAARVSAGITGRFSDVNPESGWLYNYIAIAYSYGLIYGFPDGTFRPNDPITRQEFALMLARTTTILTAGTLTFVDAASISDWALDYVYTVFTLGWMRGDDQSAFRPHGNIIRAEAAAAMSRILGRGQTTAYSLENVLDDIQVFYDAADPRAWYHFYVIEATNNHWVVMDYYDDAVVWVGVGAGSLD